MSDGSRCLRGWRNEVFGEDAVRLVSGQVALAARKGKGVEVVTLPRTEEPPQRVKAVGG